MLLSNKSSFIYGHSPHYFSVPVYAVISSCCPRKLRHASPRYLKNKPATSQNPLVNKDENISDNEVNNKDSETADEQNEFEVTFWLFFPYSEGKRVCTVTAGALGPLPFPWLRTACLGSVKTYGSHVGDWEHVTLAFKVSEKKSSCWYENSFFPIYVWAFILEFRL